MVWIRQAYPMVEGYLLNSWDILQTPLMGLFYESVSHCFDSTLAEMGSSIRDWVYDFLQKRGISRDEIATRFEDVAKTLLERLGTSARVIVYRTVVELYKEFSIAAEFTYQDSLGDKFNLLKDRVASDRLRPKRIRNPVLSNPLTAQTVRTTNLDQPSH